MSALGILRWLSEFICSTVVVVSLAANHDESFGSLVKSERLASQ
jgi:hypothetical protein